MQKNGSFSKKTLLILSIFFILSYIIIEYNLSKTKFVPKKDLTENALCFLNHCPTGSPKDNFLVNHQIYILSSNRETKFADWVAYVVKKNNLNGPSRERNWKQDPLIEEKFTLSPKDYIGAAKACHYDRGHQAPLASFSNSPYWEKTNYLSNITPQKAELNQGAWVKLEKAIRRLASDGAAIYVVTGPIYQHGVPMCHLPRKPNLAIPTAYFKVVFKSENQGVSYAAFIMSQHAKQNATMCQFAVSLKKVREMTKLKFLNSSIHRNETLLKPLGC